MPTARPRYMLTETDDVAVALQAAALRWPEDRDRPAKLLLHLVHEGHRAVARGAEREIAARRAAIESTAGILTGVFPSGYLDRLRDDWPE